MKKSTPKKMLEFSKKGIGLVFGVVFLFLAMRNTNLDETLSIMKSIHLLPVLAIVFLKAFGLLVRGFRWRIVLEHVKRISPLTLFRISSVGEMGNYLLPARVGELFRIFLVSKRESLSKTSVLASVFLDRFLDMITVLTLFFLFSFFISVPGFMTRIGFLALLAVIVCIAGAWMLFAFDQRVERVIQRLFHSKPQLTSKLNDFKNRFAKSLRGLRNPGQVLRAVSISFFLWFVHIMSLHLVILALNLNLPWYAAGLTAVVIGLGMAVPSTPGFVGTYEFFCVTTLTIFSVDKSSALACAVISHGLHYVVVIIVGLISYMWENVDLGKFSLLKRNEGLLENLKSD